MMSLGLNAIARAIPILAVDHQKIQMGSESLTAWVAQPDRADDLLPCGDLKRSHPVDNKRLFQYFLNRVPRIQ